MTAVVSPKHSGPCLNRLSLPMNSGVCTASNVKDVVLHGHEDHAWTPRTVDELLRKRAETHPKTPLLAYPNSARGAADFVTYTAEDLDRFAEAIARKLQKNGLGLAVCSEEFHLLR